jgi:hypothetical protein
MQTFLPCFVTERFNARLTFVIGWLVFLSGVLAAATGAPGFAGYFSDLTSFPMIFSAIVLLIECGGADTRRSAHGARGRVHVYHRIPCIEKCLISHSADRFRVKLSYKYIIRQRRYRIFEINGNLPWQKNPEPMSGSL